MYIVLIIHDYGCDLWIFFLKLKLNIGSFTNRKIPTYRFWNLNVWWEVLVDKSGWSFTNVKNGLQCGQIWRMSKWWRGGGLRPNSKDCATNCWDLPLCIIIILFWRSSKSRGVKSDGWAVEDSAASQSRDMRPACNVLISSLTYTLELDRQLVIHICCICGESYFWFGMESGHWTILYLIVWYLWFHLVWFSKCLEEGTSIGGIWHLVVCVCRAHHFVVRQLCVGHVCLLLRHQPLLSSIQNATLRVSLSIYEA